MSTHPEAPPELAANTFSHWLLNPSPITEPEMAELAAQTFSYGSGLRWLEGFMWQVMFSTPSNDNGEVTMRDVGKQDMIRAILAQIHAGMNAQQPTRGVDHG